MRKTEFANGEFYHIYNRGVDKRNIFVNEFDYERFLLCILLLNDEKEGWLDVWRNLPNKEKEVINFRRLNLRKPLVEFIAYCCNPNHYHFIIRQLENRGIEKFMHRLGTAYTMFFNKKYKRSGALFQGRFKSIHIDSNDYLLYLSAYVNKNNFIHGLEDLNKLHSSFDEYKRARENNQKINICNISPVIDQFRNKEDWMSFMQANADYLKGKKEEAKYRLED